MSIGDRTIRPLQIRLYYFGPFGPFWKRHFGPSPRHFGPSRKDTSAPSKRFFGPSLKYTSAPIFRALPLRPLCKSFFKLSKLLIIHKQMIKINLKVVNSFYVPLFFSAHEYIIIKYILFLLTIYFNLYTNYIKIKKL